MRRSGSQSSRRRSVVPLSLQERSGLYSQSPWLWHGLWIIITRRIFVLRGNTSRNKKQKVNT